MAEVALYVPDSLRFLHYLRRVCFVLKLSLSTSLQKLYVPIQHYSQFFLTKYIVWMTVQIMLTAESLLPACERTAMHEKKGLNDSYVFSVHDILPSLLSLT